MRTSIFLAALLAIGCTDDPEETTPIEETDTDTDSDSDSDTDADTDSDTDSDTDVDIDEYAVLTDYMAANAMDLPDLAADWIIGAQAVFDEGTSEYFIIDIRGADDYALGHIEGAQNVAYADVVTFEAANNTSDLPVLVVCYTGQTAAHAVMALRMSGVDDAKSLKFGMSGWHPDFDKISAKQGNTTLGHWAETDDEPALQVYSVPVLETGMMTAEEILDAQIATELAEFNKITIDDALGEDFANYQFVNYWAAADYQYYGHIEGSLRIGPGELTLENVDALDPEKPIVIWCWTGQTASLVSAWLQVLGYDAKALLFSSNGMIYDRLEGHKYAPPSPGFAYVTPAP